MPMQEGLFLRDPRNTILILLSHESRDAMENYDVIEGA